MPLLSAAPSAPVGGGANPAGAQQTASRTGSTPGPPPSMVGPFAGLSGLPPQAFGLTQPRTISVLPPVALSTGLQLAAPSFAAPSPLAPAGGVQPGAGHPVIVVGQPSTLQQPAVGQPGASQSGAAQQQPLQWCAGSLPRRVTAPTLVLPDGPAAARPLAAGPAAADPVQPTAAAGGGAAPSTPRGARVPQPGAAAAADRGGEAAAAVPPLTPITRQLMEFAQWGRQQLRGQQHQQQRREAVEGQEGLAAGAMSEQPGAATIKVAGGLEGGHTVGGAPLQAPSPYTPGRLLMADPAMWFDSGAAEGVGSAGCGMGDLLGMDIRGGAGVGPLLFAGSLLASPLAAVGPLRALVSAPLEGAQPPAGGQQQQQAGGGSGGGGGDGMSPVVALLRAGSLTRSLDPPARAGGSPAGSVSRVAERGGDGGGDHEGAWLAAVPFDDIH
jgi:hypothetical protein